MNEKGGYYCAVLQCSNRTRDKNLRFFRFPKDPIRSMEWLIACNRGDLKEKGAIHLYKNHRICGQHFEHRMFTNKWENRLLPTAIPTVFCKQEGDFGYPEDEIIVEPLEEIKIEKVEIIAGDNCKLNKYGTILYIKNKFDIFQ